jgi:hypothetical protein
MVQHGAGDPDGAALVMVQNFFEDLRNRVGSGN